MGHKKQQSKGRTATINDCRFAYLKLAKALHKKPSTLFKSWTKQRIETESEKLFYSCGRLTRFFAMRKIAGRKGAWKASRAGQ